MKNLKKLLFLLTSREHNKAILLLIILIIAALLDMIGVASIFPFITFLLNPELKETNQILIMIFKISKRFGVETNQQFLLVLALLVFAILIISIFFRTLAIYLQTRFIYISEYNISKNLLEKYLHQPYSWFLSNNSSELVKNILSETTNVVEQGMRPLIELISKSVVLIAIIILLIIIDIKISLIMILSLGGVYLLIFCLVRNYLNLIGQKRLESNMYRFKIVSEAFGAVKEVKVGRLEKIYLKLFSETSKKFCKTKIVSQVIGQLPRYILESVAFLLMLIISIYIISQNGNIISGLPILAVYMFAAYRLMPALQGIYSSIPDLTFVGPSLDKIYNAIKDRSFSTLSHEQGFLSLNKSISLNNISYTYPNTSIPTLKNINLSISAKTTVGFIGATGSGKTTTVDIILGLLVTQNGTLEIDEKVISEKNVRAWQKSIGYVPQNIFLSDDSIASNIALGVAPKDIKQDMVEKVSKVAKLHDFIIAELPNKYLTIIGERGVRLSGGQRQRIGIARALYLNPKILILDEATAALDNQTEESVMDMINNFNKDMTTIIVAHRLNSLKNCSNIFVFDKGQIQAQIKYDEIDDYKKYLKPLKN